MFVRRILFSSSAVALGLGLAGVPAAVWADNAPSTSSPTVSQTAGTFVVTLPGVGSLSFGVDPTSGALTDLMVTPAAGSDFTAGTPQLTDEGVQVLFTGATGSQLLEVEVEEGPMPEVTAEVQAPEDAADANEAEGADVPGQDDGGQPATTGEDNGTSGQGQVPTSGDNQSGDGQSGDNQSGDGQSGDVGTTTTTTAPTSQGTGTSSGDGQDQSGDGQSSDGGSGGGGSDGGSGGSGQSSGSDG